MARVIFLLTLSSAFIATTKSLSLSYDKEGKLLRDKFSSEKSILLAQGAPSKRRPNVEADTKVTTQKRGNQTQIDLEESSLEGSSRAPSLSGVQGAQVDTDYDFVKLRKKWHPEMMKSTMNLGIRK